MCVCVCVIFLTFLKWKGCKNFFTNVKNVKHMPWIKSIKHFLHHEVTRTSVQRFVHDTHVQGAQTGFQFFLALSVLQRLWSLCHSGAIQIRLLLFVIIIIMPLTQYSFTDNVNVATCTVCTKKQDSWLLAITLPNTVRFSKFFVGRFSNALLLYLAKFENSKLPLNFFTPTLTS